MPEIQHRKNQKAVDKQRPFLGLRSFEEMNKSQFGGRDEEIQELFGLDEDSVLTVIFGKSGIGKTSLIKAGLIPELRQNFYFPIYIRIDYSSKSTPLDQVRKIVYEKMKEKDPGIENIGNATLWEYFHNVDLLDDLVVPVLILDQFEEIFTLGEGREDVQRFLVELADLSENRIPLRVQAEYQKKNLTVPTHYAELPYRVILSLREDYLARLEELKKYIPSIMNSRFRVVQMTIHQAMDAAIKPGYGLIDETVAKEIIKKLPGVTPEDFEVLDRKKMGTANLKVEPFLLSLICDRINQKRIEKKLDKFTVDLVSNFNVTDVINSFYEETIFKYGEEVEKAIENRLLTEGGFRKLQALEEFQRKYEISDEVIDQLVDARILRKEIRDGVDYIELIHDVLAPVIKRKRDKRARLEKEQKRERAIVIAKKKQRAKLIRVSSIVAVVLSMILTAAIWLAYIEREENKRTKLRHDKMALARSLMQSSQMIGLRNPEESVHKAILAYHIFDATKDTVAGEEIYTLDFYNTMYGAMNSLEPEFFTPPKPSFPWDFDKFMVSDMLYVKGQDTFLAFYDGTLRSQEGTILLNTSERNGIISSMELYSEEGKNILALAGTFDSILFYDVDLARITRTLGIPDAKDGPKWIGYTDTGGLLLSQGNQVWKWDDTFETVSKLDALQGENYEISMAKIFPDMGSLVFGTSTGEVLLRDIRASDSMAVRRLAHSSRVKDIALSTDERYMATASADGTIVLWDLKTRTSLSLKASLFWPDRAVIVYDVWFSPEGDFVLGLYGDNSVIKWPVSPRVLAEELCEVTKRELTVDKQRLYLEDNDLNRELSPNLIDDLLNAGFDCSW